MGKIFVAFDKAEAATAAKARARLLGERGGAAALFFAPSTLPEFSLFGCRWNVLMLFSHSCSSPLFGCRLEFTYSGRVAAPCPESRRCPAPVSSLTASRCERRPVSADMIAAALRIGLH